jgi:tetratricopeptide (TPR) repeat protein
MTEPVPLPSLPAPPRTHWLDAVLAGLVCTFAFLAASFTVRNSDFWLHLATGRLIAHGDYTFGVDPFAYTTSGVYWANHSWLFDLLLFDAYSRVGGPGLVVAKAALVALLAAVLLLLARSGKGFWISGSCVVLAILAMSPRLLMQPACLSLLLLAVCLWLLQKGGRALFALPVVIALWVNLDAWFLLGPLLVGLYWLGQRLAPAASEEGSRRLSWWLLPACVAACLVSPHHVFALCLPAELSPGVWSSSLRQDARFAGFFASPWRPAGGFNLAAWAFFVLLGLGALSFAVNRSARKSWRFTVWLAFALLAAWQVRLVPFFAVVAGPITARNWHEILTNDAFSRAGRPMLLLACLALMVLTWPGWLQGFHRRDRALGWDVHVEPSLKHVAETLHSWREKEVLEPEWREVLLFLPVFTTHPDVAHYCAWFCPGEKYFLDSRFLLFLPVIDDYERRCADLDLTSSAPDEKSTDSVLDEQRIDCVVLYDPDRRRLAPALGRVGAASPWRLLQVDGQALLVGDASRFVRFDADGLAYSPPTDALPSAPEEGPAELSEPRPWWRRALERPGGSSWQADAAAVYLRLFDESAMRQLDRQRIRVLSRHAAGLVGVPALSSSGIPTCAALASRLMVEGVFMPDARERPAALPLLAVRAARTAVAEHPDDAGAWLVLGQAYLSLARTTTEANPSAALPLLVQIRYVQAVTCLVQAINHNPDLSPAHDSLALLYTERGYFDLALKHRQQQLRLAKSARQPHDRLEQAIESLERVVQDNENRFAVRTHSLAADPRARARTAMQLGLAEKALNGVLLRSSPDLYGKEGLRLLLELLLTTGRAQEARALLDRDEMRRHPDGLGVVELAGGSSGGRRWGYTFPAWDWFDLCQCAGAGNYRGASIGCRRLSERLKVQEGPLRAWVEPRLAARLASEVGLAAVPEGLGLRVGRRFDRDLFIASLVQGLFMSVERADLHVIAGMLLLEQGDPQEAGEQFRRALALYRDSAATAPALPGQPLGQRYLERLR